MEAKFDGLHFTYVLWKNNQVANELAKMRSSRVTLPPKIFGHLSKKSSVQARALDILEPIDDQPQVMLIDSD